MGRAGGNAGPDGENPADTIAYSFLLVSVAVLWALVTLRTQAGARAHRLALDER